MTPVTRALRRPPRRRRPSVPTGLSIHIGLSSVDPVKCGGWDGQLNACENDARDMAAIARANGFGETVILTPDGTVENITAALRDAAGGLTAGDILLFTYSGHGAQVDDTTEDEPDTLTPEALESQFQTRDPAKVETASRLMPPLKQQEVFVRDRESYAGPQREPKNAQDAAGEPDALRISACQDNHLASDGGANGLFTAGLLKVRNDGPFEDGYRSFHRAIQRRVPVIQSPNLYLTGEPAASFLPRKPFTV
ncbi:caspase family protein [Streptomyces sp. NBC_00239]|uniref:caspase family protein n=1 Tax=Streptomyces sp. NBC_00239 TaxID=2903640 RepID=UPI002E2A1B8B|nr:caspase family protein [Streptomyces sp. NBC_00239]